MKNRLLPGPWRPGPHHSLIFCVAMWSAQSRMSFQQWSRSMMVGAHAGGAERREAVMLGIGTQECRGRLAVPTPARRRVRSDEAKIALVEPISRSSRSVATTTCCSRPGRRATASLAAVEPAIGQAEGDKPPIGIAHAKSLGKQRRRAWAESRCPASIHRRARHRADRRLSTRKAFIGWPPRAP